MPSPARTKFIDAISSAELLCLKGRATLFSRKQRQVQYHASLAASVAAWEAYIESVVRGFFDEISDPLQPRFIALHQITASRAEVDLKRFNTPNAKNSRELLYNWTGFDPINDWNWPARKLGGPATRDRLDEILQVRHSFAHGYPMRRYSWNCDAKGIPNLTAPAVSMAIALFTHLVKVTDQGICKHIKNTYSGSIAWY
ncbi:HEPN domain-containing protein [Micromonospora sp. WMMD735]|uniref:HEPN domain-containing protein n=1 Tax=Micromonospora sp. WMMD735 TaxID=3404130 RepID=UPI003B925BF0